RTTLRCIFGFWLLEVLFLAYLSDRQWDIAGLRGTLAERKKRNIELRSQSNKDLLDSLFGPGQFCDRLALEVQRAMRSKLSLAGLTVGLEVALNLPDGDDPYSAFGDAVKAMMVRLRGEDSVYRLAPGVFGIILGTSSDVSCRVASRMADGLSEA